MCWLTVEVVSAPPEATKVRTATDLSRGLVKFDLIIGQRNIKVRTMLMNLYLWCESCAWILTIARLTGHSSAALNWSKAWDLWCTLRRSLLGSESYLPAKWSIIDGRNCCQRRFTDNHDRDDDPIHCNHAHATKVDGRFEPPRANGRTPDEENFLGYKKRDFSIWEFC